MGLESGIKDLFRSHLLRQTCGEVDGEHVTGESVRRAALLVDYFKSHARKVLAAMDPDKKTAAAKKPATTPPTQ